MLIVIGFNVLINVLFLFAMYNKGTFNKIYSIIKLLKNQNLFPEFINIEILSLSLLVWILEAYRRAVP